MESTTQDTLYQFSIVSNEMSPSDKLLGKVWLTTEILGLDETMMGLQDEQDAAGDAYYRDDDDEIRLGRLDRVALENALHVANDERREVVEPFTDALEHDEAQRDAHQSVGHREQLPSNRVRRRMPVA